MYVHCGTIQQAFSIPKYWYKDCQFKSTDIDEAIMHLASQFTLSIWVMDNSREKYRLLMKIININILFKYIFKYNKWI